jgi:hypothetical protein
MQALMERSDSLLEISSFSAILLIKSALFAIYIPPLLLDQTGEVKDKNNEGFSIGDRDHKEPV